MSSNTMHSEPDRNLESDGTQKIAASGTGEKESWKATLFPRSSSLAGAQADTYRESLTYSLAVTPTRLVTVGRDQTVKVWSLATQELVYPPLKGHTASVLCATADESSDVIVSGGADGRIIFWRLSTGSKIKVIDNAHKESILSLYRHGPILATGSKDTTIKLWDISKLVLGEGNPSDGPTHPEHTLEGHLAAVNSVKVTDSNIISASGDGSIKVWDRKTLKDIRTIRVHTKGVATLALSPDGSKVISGSTDNTIRISGIETGVEEACLAGHSSLVRSACVVPGDGPGGVSKIISGSYDQTVLVWARVANEEEKWEITQRFELEEFLDVPDKAAFGAVRAYNLQYDGKKIYCANDTDRVVAFDLE